MPHLTWRAWIVVVLVGVCSATLTLFGWLGVRELVTERQKLLVIIGLIESGRIRIEPPPPPPAQK
jgi:hypothetical protein